MDDLLRQASGIAATLSTPDGPEDLAWAEDMTRWNASRWRNDGMGPISGMTRLLWVLAGWSRAKAEILVAHFRSILEQDALTLPAEEVPERYSELVHEVMDAYHGWRQGHSQMMCAPRAGSVPDLRERLLRLAGAAERLAALELSVQNRSLDPVPTALGRTS